MERKNTFSLLFYLKKTRINKNGESPIYMRITVNGKQSTLSLNRSIEVRNWNTEAGLASGKTNQSKLINNYIKSVQALIYDHFKTLREQQKIASAAALKNAFLGLNDAGKTILGIYKKHNDDIKKLVDIDFVPSTIERYEILFRHTQHFIKSKYKVDDIYLSEINHQFIKDYEMYFKTVRQCSHNTSIKYLKHFKKIIRIALVNRWMNIDPFANYKMTSKKVDKEFLNENELNILMNKKFKNIILEKVRDCFLFSCFTGLAHSDLKRLNPHNIYTGSDGVSWVKINRKKTNGQSHIPILPIPVALIKKYSNNPYCIKKNVILPVLSNQNMNKYLKKVASICDIEKNLSSHIARHTFATTVTLNNDVPIETVSKMLGHSSINTTKIYAKLLDKKVGRDMQHLHDKFNMAI